MKAGAAPEAQNAEVAAYVGEERVVVAVTVGQLDGLGQPLEQEPELLEQPEFAALSAAWWWASYGLNELADRGEFAAITRRINGGLNGQADRLALWEKAKAVLA
ncbi:chitinase family protein [Pseudomonas aeruginosa]|nr:chitinase family protein [Pseudomonas aeruginosa]